MAILSVKFSLFEKSTTYATEFASTLKCGPYLGEFETYNPNAWSKKSCDPDYTDISGPCRGTSETCGFTDDTNCKDGRPCWTSRWRFAFRFYLQLCKNTGGFMIRYGQVSSQGTPADSSRNTVVHGTCDSKGKDQLLPCQAESPCPHRGTSKRTTDQGGAAGVAKSHQLCPMIHVWSAGVVLYTCLTGKVPFKSELVIIESDYLRSPLCHISEEAKDLIAGMLKKEPEKRLSIDQCVQHQWSACSETDGCTAN